MQYPKDKIKVWKVLNDHGDAKFLIDNYRLSYYKIRQALEGSGTAKTFVAMDTYYTEKLNMLNGKEIKGSNFQFVGSNATMVDAIKENGGKI